VTGPPGRLGDQRTGGGQGTLDMHLHGYGCAGRSAAEYGLAA
jgi:hypothetical protein